MAGVGFPRLQLPVHMGHHLTSDFSLLLALMKYLHADFLPPASWHVVLLVLRLQWKTPLGLLSPVFSLLDDLGYGC